MTSSAGRFRSTIIWAAALPVFAAACLVIWLASFVLKGLRLEGLIKAACRIVLAVCGIRVEVRGLENVRPDRQYIVMMNHVNFFDPLVFYAGFPGMARGVEEESHFRWPVYGATIRRLGLIPINRRNRGLAIESLKRAASWIRCRPGYSFAIMPEGTRTLNGRLGEFKRGGFLLAIETGLEILPLIQSGAFEIARKGSLLIRPGRVDMTIEPGLSPAGFTKETAALLAERVRAVFLRRGGN